MSREIRLVAEEGNLPPLTRRQRDFLLLNVFVLLQHGYVKRASILTEALLASGDGSVEAYLARAVLSFADRRWRDALTALEVLDRIDPIERFGNYRLDQRQRMRRYLATRCLFELGETTRVRDALESYLRHGEARASGSM